MREGGQRNREGERKLLRGRKREKESDRERGEGEKETNGEIRGR